MNNILYLTIISLFLLSISCHNDGKEDSKSQNYPDFYSYLLNRSTKDSISEVNVKNLNLRKLMENNKIQQVDSIFYNKYLSDNLTIRKGNEKLYYFGISNWAHYSAIFIKTVKMNTTKYIAYFVSFKADGQIVDVFKVSEYEAYPGGSILIKSDLNSNGKIERITINSFIKNYNNKKQNYDIAVDSINEIYNINSGKINFLKKDSVRYIK